jgi:hypothetical protein
VLALPLVFPGVTKEPTAIIGEEPIGILPSDRAWLLDLPGQFTPKGHLHLILHIPDVDDKAESRSSGQMVQDCSKSTCASMKAAGSRAGRTRRLEDSAGHPCDPMNMYIIFQLTLPLQLDFYRGTSSFFGALALSRMLRGRFRFSCEPQNSLQQRR